MVVRQKFRKTPESTISFAFTDLVQNAGLIDLMAARLHDGTSVKNVLTTNSNVASTTTYTAKLAGAGTIFAATDWVGEFNKSFNIKGDILVMIPVWITNAAGADDAISATVTVLHNTDSIGTGTSTSTVVTGSVSNDNESMISFIIEDVDFRIKIGDTVTLRIAASGTGSGSSNYYVFHDPLGRTGTLSNDTSVMRMLLPVRLDFL